MVGQGDGTVPPTESRRGRNAVKLKLQMFVRTLNFNPRIATCFLHRHIGHGGVILTQVTKSGFIRIKVALDAKMLLSILFGSILNLIKQ